MTHVLVVETRELGNPLTHVIQMKADDAAFHLMSFIGSSDECQGRGRADTERDAEIGRVLRPHRHHERAGRHRMNRRERRIVLLVPRTVTHDFENRCSEYAGDLNGGPR